MIFCTVTSNKHIFLAILLAKSVKKVHPDSKVVMCLVEKDLSYIKPYLGNFDLVILAKNLGYENFSRHMFKQDEYDGPGSCKARLMKYAYDYYKNDEIFIYLDSDTYVYSAFDDLTLLLKESPILLSSHILTPNEDIELKLVNAGVYNSGLLALSRSSETNRFLNWWVARLDMYGYVEPAIGTYGDQRWLDVAPSLFKVKLLPHPGYNIAWWNLYERRITITKEGQPLVNGLPLKLMHFTGILLLKDKYKDFLSKFEPHPKSPIYFLVDQYTKMLRLAGQNFNKLAPWSYSNFHSGEKIDLMSRKNFRQNLDKFININDPFSKSNKIFNTSENNKHTRNKHVKIQKSMKKKISSRRDSRSILRKSSLVNSAESRNLLSTQRQEAVYTGRPLYSLARKTYASYNVMSNTIRNNSSNTLYTGKAILSLGGITAGSFNVMNNSPTNKSSTPLYTGKPVFSLAGKRAVSTKAIRTNKTYSIPNYLYTGRKSLFLTRRNFNKLKRYFQRFGYIWRYFPNNRISENQIPYLGRRKFFKNK